MTIIKPYVNEVFAGQIWRFLIDSKTNLLFVETRNVDTREAKFTGISLNNGKNNFKDLILEEKWLTGIEGCYNDILLLHGYQSTQSPVHKGVTAVDGVTNEILWSNYNYAIQQISSNGPIVYNTQIHPQKLVLINEYNGATIRAFDASIDLDINSEIEVPDTLETLDSDIKQHVKGDIVGNIHYMEYNSFRIVSLHTLIKTQLSQVLLIMQAGNLVYEDLLIDKIQKLQPEAFIMHRNRLIYIRNKVELKVLNL